MWIIIKLAWRNVKEKTHALRRNRKESKNTITNK